MRLRIDKEGKPLANGSIPCYAIWVGGPSLSAVRNCPCDSLPPRTVYITGPADTFFSVPAECRHKGKRIRGFVSRTAEGYTFTSYLAERRAGT